MANKKYIVQLLRPKKCTELPLQGLLFLTFVYVSLVSRTPNGLEDVSKYPDLFEKLLQSGMWTSDDLKKLAGQNFLRIFKEVEKVSKIFVITYTFNALLVFRSKE